MNRLVSILGPAPSELSFSELIARLEVERSRVRAALERFRTQPIKSVVRTKKPTSDEAQIKRMIKDGLITQEEILKIIQAQGADK